MSWLVKAIHAKLAEAADSTAGSMSGKKREPIRATDAARRLGAKGGLSIQLRAGLGIDWLTSLLKIG